jgi:hypothetical protein
MAQLSRLGRPWQYILLSPTKRKQPTFQQYRLLSMTARSMEVARKMRGQTRGKVEEAPSLHQLPRLKALLQRRTPFRPVVVAATSHHSGGIDGAVGGAWPGKSLLVKPSTG